jgi:dUTP pyrophosphatase
MFVEIKKFASSKDLPLPSYATSGSAGMDLYAANFEPIIIEPFGRALVPTGIAIALPEGLEAQVRPRSGLAIKNGITVLNSPGTIDADYRGEISVILINLSNQNFTIERAARIAQLVIASCKRISWQQVGDLSITSRNGGGFGSTGT